MNKFYSKGLFEDKILINYFTYKGRGRPRKTDYITPIQAQKKLNQYMNFKITTIGKNPFFNFFKQEYPAKEVNT